MSMNARPTVTKSVAKLTPNEYRIVDLDLSSQGSGRPDLVAILAAP